MEYAVIDIGSNSVRCMLHDGVASRSKEIATTRLALGMGRERMLQPERMRETADAVRTFYRQAIERGAQTYVFATAAVRGARNGGDFVRDLATDGIAVDVVSGETEARLGFAGAYTQGVCAVIDIGGGSTELSVGDAHGMRYARSVPLGLAVVHDACKEDAVKTAALADELYAAFDDCPPFDTLLGIGGTVTSFAAICQGLDPYDARLTDGYCIQLDELRRRTEEIARMSLVERAGVVGLQPKRRDLIVGGGRILAALTERLHATRIRVRESDNLEGYLYARLRERGDR